MRTNQGLPRLCGTRLHAGLRTQIHPAGISERLCTHHVLLQDEHFSDSPERQCFPPFLQLGLHKDLFRFPPGVGHLSGTGRPRRVLHQTGIHRLTETGGSALCRHHPRDRRAGPFAGIHTIQTGNRKPEIWHGPSGPVQPGNIPFCGRAFQRISGGRRTCVPRQTRPCGNG